MEQVKISVINPPALLVRIQHNPTLFRVLIQPPPSIKVVVSPRPVGNVVSTGGRTYPMPSSTQWVVVHNRGYRPSITCTDHTGEVILPEIKHVSLNEVHINHLFNQAGTVYII